MTPYPPQLIHLSNLTAALRTVALHILAGDGYFSIALISGYFHDNPMRGLIVFHDQAMVSKSTMRCLLEIRELTQVTDL